MNDAKKSPTPRPTNRPALRPLDDRQLTLVVGGLDMNYMRKSGE